MASYERRGQAWRARVYVNHVRDSRTFRTKAEAVTWANLREAELTGKALPDHTLKDALERFAREVAPTHKGERWEVLRCRRMGKDRIAAKRIGSLTTTDVADWRDRRLQTVSRGAVRREMSLLQSVFDVARREWRWLHTNPMDDVRKPTAPASRKRRISQDEADRITLALGYDGGEPVNTSHRVALAFLLALETAMRSGEILGLTWADVGEKSVALPVTKNGDARSVPLSKRAREILALLPRDGDSVFGLQAGTRDALFRKARDKAKVENLRFHDSRAEAIWRLSKKLDVMELARVIGHRDLRSLMIYYSASADEMADRLG